jgi:hypothetical protein
LLQPVKVPSSNPASGKESALTGEEKPKIERRRKKTEGTAMMAADLFILRYLANTKTSRHPVNFSLTIS